MHLDTKVKELQDELVAQKEDNNRMRSLVEDQKDQLAKRERHIKVAFFCLRTGWWQTANGRWFCSGPQGLCKALQELRAEMVNSAEEKSPVRAAPRKEDPAVQNMVHKQTRELKVGFLHPHHHTLVRSDVIGQPEHHLK